MAFLESHEELRNHPKTRKATRLLGIGVPQFIGHLHLLWYWAMNYAQDGDLSGYENYEIADGAMWDGDPNVFVDALLRCGRPGAAGFLEQVDTDDGIMLLLHDWDDYAGKIIAKRKADAERKRNGRLGLPSLLDTNSEVDVHRTSDGHPQDGAGTIPNLTIPNLTIPNTTVPNQTQPSATNAAESAFQDFFSQFWELYPKNGDGKKPGKPEAEKAARKIAVKDRLTVLRAVKNYCLTQSVKNGMVKYPQGFLNPSFWQDHIEPPTGGNGNVRSIKGTGRIQADSGEDKPFANLIQVV